MTFAENMRSTRQRLFLSQEALAKELNVALSTVNRWETGKSKPNLSKLKQLKEFCEKNSADYKPLEESWFLFERKS